MKTRLREQSYRAVLLSLASLGLCLNSIQAQQWTEVPVGEDPGTSADAMVYDSIRNVVVLQDNASSGSRDTWEWDGEVWKHVSDEGPAGYLFSSAFDEARGVVVLDGGYATYFNGVPALSDTWEWDGATWKKVASGGKPRAAMAAMVYHPARGTVIRHGGVSNWGGADLERYSDTWEWDGEVWIEIQESGGPARSSHQMVYDGVRGELVMFGGLDLPADGPGTKNDTWAFTAGGWRKLEGITGPLPLHRREHALVFDKSRGVTMLFGGRNDGTRFNDLWEWDGTRWAEIPVAGKLPPARSGVSAVFDEVKNQMMILGGSNGSGGLKDQWYYDSDPAVRIGHVIAWPAVVGAQDYILESADDPEGPWMEYEAERATIGAEVVVPIPTIDRAKCFRALRP